MAWHEQMVTIPVEDEGLVLEGVWQSGSVRGAVVAPPHPELGGSLDDPVVNEIAYGLYRCGYASLRFNWRGVGASQGLITSDWGAAERDYSAAVEHVASTLDAPITATGYSFGAATAMRIALVDSRISDVVLVSPPASMIKQLAIEEFAGPIRVIVGGSDPFASVEDLSSLLVPLPNAALDVIPKADHFFRGSGLAELTQLLRSAAG